MKLIPEFTRVKFPSGFISHYVQMKRTTLTVEIAPDDIFISHYVQMKLPPINATINVNVSLYPTTFR